MVQKENNKLKRNCEIFQRFIEDIYSRGDIDYIIKCFDNHVSNKSLVSACKDYWYHHFDKPADSESESNFESILDRIHHHLNLMNNKPLSTSTSGLARKIFNTSLNVFYRVAAITVIGLLIAASYYYIRNDRFITEGQLAYSEIIAPPGSRIKIDLPDGSTAWLNHGTVLKYPQKFSKKSRELFISGEAYFNVIKEKNHPFILKTSDVDIHVLGTSFNVMAYNDDQDIEVTLETGSLDLYYSSQDKSTDKIASLKPGDRIVIDRDSRKISKHYGNTDVYTAWKDGIIIFRDDLMDVIVKKLERWYDVEIELVSEELTKYRFTATFTDETLPQVLHLLSVAVPIDYTIKPRIKQNDNSFSKSKVILKLRGSPKLKK